MKGLSLWQPWTTLVAIGAKRIETRSWRTDYRGWLAIHATQAFPQHAVEETYDEPIWAALEKAGVVPFEWLDQPTLRKTLPRGAIVAVANLHRVGEIGTRADGATYVRGQELPVEGDELVFGDYTPGRYGWVLTNVGALKEPISCKGARGLWDVSGEIVAQLHKQGMAQ